LGWNPQGRVLSEARTFPTRDEARTIAAAAMSWKGLWLGRNFLSLLKSPFAKLLVAKIGWGS
jgi:hypothetical protein